MSDKSETCGMCEGQGVTGIAGHLCDRCNGTGVRTTGEVVHSVVEDDLDPDDIFIHPVPPKSVSRPFVAAERVDELEATIAEQAAEIERLKGEPIRGMQRLQAETIREQMAEIERLKGQLSSCADQRQRLNAERDTLRLEVARLRDRLLQSLTEGGADQAEAEKQVCTLADDLDEANARVVALEAERDELRANLGLSLRHSGEMASKLDRLRGDVEELKIQRDAIEERFNAQTEKLVALDRERWDIEAERDELRTKIEMITEGRDCYRSAHDTLKDDFVAVEFQRDAAEARVTQLLLDIGSIESGRDRALYAEAEANARAEKYLAVIETGDRERTAIIAMHNAAMRALGVRSSAGLPIYVEPTDGGAP